MKLKMALIIGIGIAFAHPDPEKLFVRSTCVEVCERTLTEKGDIDEHSSYKNKFVITTQEEGGGPNSIVARINFMDPSTLKEALEMNEVGKISDFPKLSRWIERSRFVLDEISFEKSMIGTEFQLNEIYVRVLGENSSSMTIKLSRSGSTFSSFQKETEASKIADQILELLVKTDEFLVEGENFAKRLSGQSKLKKEINIADVVKSDDLLLIQQPEIQRDGRKKLVLTDLKRWDTTTGKRATKELLQRFFEASKASVEEYLKDPEGNSKAYNERIELLGEKLKKQQKQ